LPSVLVIKDIKNQQVAHILNDLSGMTVENRAPSLHPLHTPSCVSAKSGQYGQYDV
jgi:hypothetical protein